MDIEKILLIIKIIWYLIKYDFEIVPKIDSPIYKSNRFVNIYKVDNNTLLKQIHHYSEYSICSPVKDNFNIPLFNKNSFASTYIIYCLSLLPKWFTIQNREKYHISQLPKIWDVDKLKLCYKEEIIKTINPKNLNKYKIGEIIENELYHMNKFLDDNNLYFVFLERKNMTITNNNRLKIIEGEVWTEYQFKTIKKIINKWYPTYKFNNYKNLNRIMV